MPTIVNCHTHIFNLECIPENFLGKGVIKLMGNNRISLPIVRLLDGVFGSQSDFLKKQASFLKYNTEDWQELIFQDLQKIYPPGTKFIVLTLDMDFMGAGVASRNYLTQLHEIVQLKRKHPDELLPFLCIDPRRGNAQQNLDFSKRYIEGHGFFGIKLYPPLGFFPFDSRLDLVYKYAEENQIPLISHCYKDGGVYYKGAVQQDWLNPRPGVQYTYEKKMVNFRNHLMHPSHYEIVFQKFPKLKMCLAHFGGHKEILRHKKGKTDSWHTIIRNYILNPAYPNVHADISYTLYDPHIHTALQKEIEEPVIGKRILFGTDFYMTERDKKEQKLSIEFRDTIGAEAFNKIAHENAFAFLSSRFNNLTPAPSPLGEAPRVR